MYVLGYGILCCIGFHNKKKEMALNDRTCLLIVACCHDLHVLNCHWLTHTMDNTLYSWDVVMLGSMQAKVIFNHAKHQVSPGHQSCIHVGGLWWASASSSYYSFIYVSILVRYLRMTAVRVCPVEYRHKEGGNCWREWSTMMIMYQCNSSSHNSIISLSHVICWILRM